MKFTLNKVNCIVWKKLEIKAGSKATKEINMIEISQKIYKQDQK